MLIVKEKPKSIVSESYRAIRTNIKYASSDKEYKVITVTSSEEGEGKSTVSSNLALAFAQGEDKVLLIDCDLRIPTIHKNFKVSNEAGISDIIVKKLSFKDVAIEYDENLTILTSGYIPPNPSEMLSSQAMSNFLDKMREKFDYIIIDTPPLMAVTDAQVISAKTDGVLLAVRYGKTKKENVQNSINMITRVNGNVIGTLLTRAEEKNNSYYYYENDGVKETRKERRKRKKAEKKLRAKEIMV